MRRTAGLWGSAGFVIAALLGARRQPGYDHRRFHISGLAASGTRSWPIMIPGFIALGLADIVATAPAPASRAAAAVPVLRRAGGLATILAGVVRCSDVRCPKPAADPEATKADAGHALFSIAAFITWVLLPFASASTRSGSRRDLDIALGVATTAGFVAAGLTTEIDSGNKGVAQRGFVGAALLWRVVDAIAR